MRRPPAATSKPWLLSLTAIIAVYLDICQACGGGGGPRCSENNGFISCPGPRYYLRLGAGDWNGAACDAYDMPHYNFEAAKFLDNDVWLDLKSVAADIAGAYIWTSLTQPATWVECDEGGCTDQLVWHDGVSYTFVDNGEGVDGRNDKGCLFMKTDGKLDDGACTEDYQMVCSIDPRCDNLGNNIVQCSTNRYYRYTAAAQTMDESRQQCESQADQRLVHFPDTETYEDVRFISQRLLQANVWTGLKNSLRASCEDAACTGQLLWDDWTAFDQSAAAYQYIKGDSSTACIEFRTDGTNREKSCSTDLKAVCGLGGTTDRCTAVDATTFICDTERFYKKPAAGAVGYDDARAACEAEAVSTAAPSGYELAHYKDQDTYWDILYMTVVATLLTTNMWTGLRNPNGHSCTDADCTSKLVWDDGTAFDYAGAPYQTISSHYSRDCVKFMPDGNLDYEHCTTALQPLCSIAPAPRCVDKGSSIVLCEGARTYMYTSTAANFDGSRTACEANAGYRLAHYMDQESYEDVHFIVASILHYNGWTALRNPNGHSCTEADCTSKLIWDDGIAFDFTDASYAYTYAHYSKDCVEHRTDGTIRELSCSSTRQAVCSPAPTPRCVDQGSNVVLCEGTRTYMYTSTPASLDDSRTACEANAGYRLAHYTDQDSYDDVHDIVANVLHFNGWTGLRNPNGHSCTEGDCTNKLIWDDGTRFDFSHASYAYTYAHYSKDCVEHRTDGTIRELSCSSTRKAVCSEKPPPRCVDQGSNTVLCEGTRTYMYTDTAANFDDARAACEANAGYRLAHYMDQDSYEDVHDIVASILHYNGWTGLRNPNGQSCTDADCTNKLIWDDGTRFDFTHASYAYIYAHYSKDCVEHRTDGTVRELSCSSTRKAVCSPAPTPRCVDQGSNAILCEGARPYMYTSTAANYDGSRTACEANAGYQLAHYTDQDSYDDVHFIVASILHFNGWTGLRNPNGQSCTDADCTSKLIWDVGTSFDFTHASYAYVYGHYSKDCVEYRTDGTIIKLGCSTTLQAVCSPAPTPRCVDEGTPNTLLCEGSRYYMYTSASSHTAAKTACESVQGYSLALFRDQASYEDVHFIVASVLHFNGWTGLSNPDGQSCTDAACSTKLKWDDGEDFDFADASYGYTYGHYSKDCVEFRTDASIIKLSCSTSLQAVCSAAPRCPVAPLANLTDCTRNTTSAVSYFQDTVVRFACKTIS